jgi:PAS domain S-box-containing protein
MEEKIYWSRLEKEDLTNSKLSLEDFYKILDCYYGNIFVTDGNGITLYFNEKGWGKLGLSRKEHVGKHVSYFVEHGIFRRSVTTEVLKTRRQVTMESVDYDGKPFWVHAVPIFDDDDNIILTVHYSQYQVEISNFLGEIERSRDIINHLSGVVEHYSKNIGNNMKLIYRSQKMSQLVQESKKVAKTDGAVLIGGESGTGKELLARYIYNESRRNKGVFLTINCAAIPNELIESELFGYKPGAFTGASKEGKPGIFELADGGTIFLDEVGEIPMPVQSKLLRVLENGEVSRIGSTSSSAVDVRIIAATNRDLQAMVRENTFREDLFYRLQVLTIETPPSANGRRISRFWPIFT